MAPDDSRLHAMNRALDSELSEEEQAAFQAELEESPADAVRWNKLHRTDDLLRTTPLIAPASDFSRRVMAAVAAMPVPQFIRRNPGLGIALGLAVAALFTIPVFSVLLFLMFSVFTDPGALNGLFQTLINTAGYVIDLTGNILDEIQSFANGTSALPLVLTAMVPVTIVWGWLIWVLVGNRNFLNRRTKS